MRKLATRCGYTAPTIYHYFGDKVGLLDTLLALRLAELVAELRAVPVSSDLAANMRELAIAFVRWGLANSTHYQLLTTARAPESDPLPSGEEARELLAHPITELALRGHLLTDLETGRQALWALLHGLISLQRTRPDVEWSGALTESAIDAMIHGLVKEERS
jgi:AcrR family transcriptional regulator